MYAKSKKTATLSHQDIIKMPLCHIHPKSSQNKIVNLCRTTLKQPN